GGVRVRRFLQHGEPPAVDDDRVVVHEDDVLVGGRDRHADVAGLGVAEVLPVADDGDPLVVGGQLGQPLDRAVRAPVVDDHQPPRRVVGHRGERAEAGLGEGQRVPGQDDDRYWTPLGGDRGYWTPLGGHTG